MRFLPDPAGPQEPCAVNGETYAPMRPGMATLIGYTNGRVDITAWSGGSAVSPGSEFGYTRGYGALYLDHVEQATAVAISTPARLQ
jgi:hypothetical protein